MLDVVDNSSALKNEENMFITAREASAVSSYTTAHIARLAKQGKIHAEFRNGRWHIDPDSLKTFLKNIERKKDLQKKEIRQERVSELLKAKEDSLLLEKSNISPLSSKAFLESVAMAGLLVSFFAWGQVIGSKFETNQLNSYMGAIVCLSSDGCEDTLSKAIQNYINDITVTVEGLVVR